MVMKETKKKADETHYGTYSNNINTNISCVGVKDTHYLPIILGKTVLVEFSLFSFELDEVASPLVLAAGAGGSWRGFLPDVTFGGGAGGGNRPDVLATWFPWLRL